jgi:hypothetical protein
MSTLARWATFRGNADGTVTIRFSYCPDLILELAAGIPTGSRQYDPHDGNAWTVTRDFVYVAFTLLIKYFPEAELLLPGEPQDGPSAVTTQSRTNHFAVLHLLPTAPWDVIDAAYRALMKRHDTDKGGDSAPMRRLSEAHEALRRRMSA